MTKPLPLEKHSSVFTHEYMVMKTCRHGTLLFNQQDTFVGRSLDLYGEWCEAEIGLLAQVLKPGDVVLDVGANIGCHTVPFAKLVGESGRVVAFEPQRLVFQNLCANLALNALRNVVTYDAGVGKDAGWMHLPVFDPRQQFNFAAISMTGHESGPLTRVLKIDDLKFARCNLIKVDVEGMEVDVLAGAAKTIEQLRPALFVENNTLDRSRPLMEMLQSLNYVPWWHIRSYFNPNNFFGNPENVFESIQPEANLLCFHRETSAEIVGLVPVIGTDDDWQKAWARQAAS